MAVRPGEAREALIRQAEEALQQTNLDLAEQLCLQALHEAREPKVMLLLAIVLANAGRPQHAIQVLTDLLEIDPRNIEAFDWLATLLVQIGEAEDATKIALHALRLRPDSPPLLNTLGQAYLVQGKSVEAAACFEKAIEAQPDNPMFHHNRGIAMQQMDSESEAVASFRKAIELAPHLPNSYTALGAYMLAKNQKHEAIRYYRKALEADPGPHSLVRLANALNEAEQFEEASERLREAIALNPDEELAHEMLGIRLQDLGNFDEAIHHFERARALAPDLVGPLYGISRCRKFTPEDQPMIELMQAMLKEDTRSTEELRDLQYALGKAYDDLGRYETAMHHFDEANRLAKLFQNSRPMVKEARVEMKAHLMSVFSKDFFTKHADLGIESELPIFIVGMIRSGTTLVEQIVSSHPDVTAGGELTFWLDKPAGDMLESILRGNPKRQQAIELAEDYRRLLRSLGPKAKRVTDKMPINYLALGLMHLLFPNARIIHCRRNPVDTCLSIYITPLGEGPSFAYDKDNIVFAYEEYLRLMDHWRKVIPADRFLDVDYEALVANREQVTRDMIAFCGLEWNDACLHHEKNERSVRTPSRWQARQPIYKSSVERWRRYEPWLGSFKQLLEES